MDVFLFLQLKVVPDIILDVIKLLFLWMMTLNFEMKLCLVDYRTRDLVERTRLFFGKVT